MGVCLRAKNNAKDKTGHAFVDFDNMDPREIFGRFILCGLDYRYDSKGYFIPTQTEEAVNILNTPVPFLIIGVLIVNDTSKLMLFSLIKVLIILSLMG